MALAVQYSHASWPTPLAYVSLDYGDVWSAPPVVQYDNVYWSFGVVLSPDGTRVAVGSSDMVYTGTIATFTCLPSVTDGVASLFAGNFSSLISVESDLFTDGTATLSSGVLTTSMVVLS